jgi:hypothetical protein
MYFCKINLKVEKPGSIIYWSFKTLNYDIKCGLFYIKKFTEESLTEQLKEDKAKPLLTSQRTDSHSH